MKRKKNGRAPSAAPARHQPPPGSPLRGGPVPSSRPDGPARHRRRPDPNRACCSDTVTIAVPGLPAPLDAPPLSLRIRGVDCPESGSRARCPEEAQRAADAAAFTAAAVAGAGAVAVELCGWDKYGGRVLGDVLLRDGGRLGERLIAAGHAVRYAGHGPRRDWCSAEAPDGDEDGRDGRERCRRDGRAPHLFEDHGALAGE